MRSLILVVRSWYLFFFKFIFIKVFEDYFVLFMYVVYLFRKKLLSNFFIVMLLLGLFCFMSLLLL